MEKYEILYRVTERGRELRREAEQERLVRTVKRYRRPVSYREVVMRLLRVLFRPRSQSHTGNIYWKNCDPETQRTVPDYYL